MVDNRVGDSTSERRLSRIAAKLATVEASPDRWGGVFGAEEHSFRLSAPMTEAAVAAFEAGHGVTLPGGYRRFLLELGSEGAGPDYGLRIPSYEICGNLAAPSFIEPGQERITDWSYAYLDAGQKRWQGTLAVVDHGCSVRTLLIVTGRWRGRLAHADVDGAYGPYLLEDTDFLSWYERWLDELLSGCNVSMFGWQKLPGNEHTLRHILTSDPSPARRQMAARSLAALPRLSRNGRQALLASTRDTDPLVREEALEALTRSKTTSSGTVER
ncbi:SMI1/KNR4 family protein [Catellatospora sp. NPDC049111]|uniref:SMI1/KNR4 family protein n=1 Tax=Catellatospora sp. NPDC049111 TaxID=3155271 RepID=UPI0033FC123E